MSRHDGVNPTDLARNLNEIVPVLDSLGRKITKADLTNPSPNFAQEILFKLLVEIGMSEAMLEVPNMMFSASSLPPNMLEPLVISVACRKFFQRIRFYDLHFGLSDLTSPEGPRLRKFLWNISNFWLFVNHNYDQVEAVKQGVEEKAKLARDIQSQINKKAKERDQIRIDAETMKMSNEQLEKDIQATRTELSQAQTDCVQLAEASKDIKSRHKAATDEQDGLNDKLEKLQKEKKRLETLVSMDQTKLTMEKEVKQLKEDHERKELDIQRIKRDLQELNIKVEEFKTQQRDLQELCTLKEQIRISETSMQQLQLEKDETSATRTSLNEELQVLHSELKAREVEMAKEASDWAVRKASLEAEIKDYTQELESARNGKSHAEIVASDLEQEIAKFSHQLESLEKQSKEHGVENATLICGILDQYKKFESEVKETLRSKVLPAFESLSKK